MDAPTEEPPPSRFDPLRNLRQMAQLIADTTGVAVDDAERRLEHERTHPGHAVKNDVAARGVPRYTAGPAMDAFYTATDAFLYELACWNRNRVKHAMRRWIAGHMNRAGRSLDVLSVGDGMGFDCLYWSRNGHRVTYFELPGLGERFARRLFDKSGVSIPMLTDPAAIPTGAFDAITCLDVLEHVPDPPAIVRSLASYLRPGGLLYVSAPFYLILPWWPTHLKANRKYAASLSLFRQAGLELVGGTAAWGPVVLRKPGGDMPDVSSAAQKLAVRLGAALWLPGRFSAWQYAPLRVIQKWTNRKFE